MKMGIVEDKVAQETNPRRSQRWMIMTKRLIICAGCKHKTQKNIDEPRESKGLVNPITELGTLCFGIAVETNWMQSARFQRSARQPPLHKMQGRTCETNPPLAKFIYIYDQQIAISARQVVRFSYSFQWVY